MTASDKDKCPRGLVKRSRMWGNVPTSVYSIEIDRDRLRPTRVTCTVTLDNLLHSHSTSSHTAIYGKGNKQTEQQSSNLPFLAIYLLADSSTFCLRVALLAWLKIYTLYFGL